MRLGDFEGPVISQRRRAIILRLGGAVFSGQSALACFDPWWPNPRKNSKAASVGGLFHFITHTISFFGLFLFGGYWPVLTLSGLI
jgi:hypothetical protein